MKVAYNRITGHPVAVKMLNLSVPGQLAEERHRRKLLIKREVKIMSGIKHVSLSILGLLNINLTCPIEAYCETRGCLREERGYQCVRHATVRLAYSRDKYLDIVMELAPFGTLGHLIEEAGAIRMSPPQK